MIDINYGVVLAATVASLVAGGVWYALFGKILIKLRELTAAEQEQAKKHQGIMFGSGFVLTLVTALALYYVVAMAQHFYGTSAAASGWVVALGMYAGFVVPVQAGHIVFGNYGHMLKKIKLFGINTGAQLVGMLAMGLVIGWLK